MKAGVPRSTLQENAYRDAVWRKARPLFVFGSILQENALQVAVWRKPRPVFVTLQECYGTQRGEKLVLRQECIRHELLASAKPSTGRFRAFRISNTEVKDPHCRRMPYKSQCGERLIRLSFQGQGYLGRKPLAK
jgi:hypothetical protein